MGLAFAGMLMASCADSPTAVADYQVVPMPLEITAASQGSFLLKSGETICYTARVIQQLARFVEDEEERRVPGGFYQGTDRHRAEGGGR